MKDTDGSFVVCFEVLSNCVHDGKITIMLGYDNWNLDLVPRVEYQPVSCSVSRLWIKETMVPVLLVELLEWLLATHISMMWPKFHVKMSVLLSSCYTYETSVSPCFIQRMCVLKISGMCFVFIHYIDVWDVTFLLTLCFDKFSYFNHHRRCLEERIITSLYCILIEVLPHYYFDKFVIWSTCNRQSFVYSVIWGIPANLPYMD